MTFDPLDAPSQLYGGVMETGALTFDPEEARTHIFAEELAGDLAAEALASAIEEGLDWNTLGRAVAYSWDAPGMKRILSRKLRKAFYSNPAVKDTFAQFVITWLEVTDEML